MKRKVFTRFVLIAVISILSTTILLSATYYRLLSEQVIENLKTCIMLLEGYDMSDAEQVQQVLNKKDLRITFIDSLGRVVFDSRADYRQMDNHSSRPEIKEAICGGEGQTVRKSKTLGHSTFYYAIRQDDGSILRVAQEVDNTFGFIVNSIPGLLILLCLLSLFGFALSWYLTNNLMVPIEKFAENPAAGAEPMEYKELAPIMEMLRKQNQDIMKSAKIRQDFTANVTHELKTPLTSISGYAELIESGMASEGDVIRFAGGIHKNANRLLTLINDTIRLSELDSEEQEINMERLNLYELAETCVEMLSMNAEKHLVTVQCKGRDCYLTGNRQMMEELLYNLCDNAIRYNNENGTVMVEVYPRDSRAVLMVQDTGIGIPKEHQERIFERFYRVDKSRSKSSGGTGLGLAIVKHILQKHNAQISLESEAGKGTRIMVVFPSSQS